MVSWLLQPSCPALQGWLLASALTVCVCVGLMQQDRDPPPPGDASDVDRSLTTSSSSSTLFVSSSHSCCLLDSLKSLRDLRDLCDVTLCVATQEVPAHRVVLAGCSPYFNAMFTNEHRESQQSRIELSGIDADTLESLITYVYTASVEITEANVQTLLAGANLLGLVSVLEACCSFLKQRLSPENCLGITSFADMHGCAALHASGWRFTVEHFAEVVQSEEFLSCPTALLAELVQSDDLGVGAEEEVLASVLRWLQHNEPERRSSLLTILQHVRLPLIAWDHLSSSLLPLEAVASSPDCQLLIEQARRVQLNSDLSSMAAGSLYSAPRKSFRQSMFLYIVGGETGPGRVTVNTLERYNPSKNTWRTCAAMATKRRGIGVGLVQGQLYAAGGSDGVNALQTVECYSPAADAWHRVADMTEPRSSMGAGVLNGHLYAVGGYDGSTTCLSSVERYDPAADSWTRVGDMLVRRSMMGVGVAGGWLLAVGGYDGITDLSSCEAYDPEQDCWEEVREMHSRRCMAAVATLGGLLFAVGGCDCSLSLGSVEVGGRGYLRGVWLGWNSRVDRNSRLGIFPPRLLTQRQDSGLCWRR